MSNLSDIDAFNKPLKAKAIRREQSWSLEIQTTKLIAIFITVNVKIYLETNMEGNIEKILSQFVSEISTNLLNNQGELILEPIKTEDNFSEYSYKFSFINEFGIVLTFFLTKYGDESDNHWINVFIENVKMQDDFILRDWLKYEGYQFDQDPFTFKAYHEDNLELQIEGFIHFLRETFENEKLKEILQGKYWEETPFDWAGLR